MIGWAEILKGILPDSLVKIDNRKLIIKDSEVVFGDKSINDVETINKIFAKISEYKNQDSLPFNLVHEDIADEFFAYEELLINQKESLTLLKKILLDDDVECIMMARRVLISWDKKDKILSDNLIKQLEKNYPKNGKKVLNLMTAGYFDNLIIPIIEAYRLEHGEEKYIQEYRKFYRELLTFFPTAIFVGNNTTEEIIKRELERRLNLKGIPFIRIHAMGEINIKKVELVMNNLNQIKNFSIKDNRFASPTGVKAQMIEIKLESKKA